MKPLIIPVRTPFLLLLLLLSLLSCNKDEARTKVFHIASEKPLPAMDSSFSPLFWVKEDGYNKWGMFSNSIENFIYEEGYEYIIKVKLYPLKNPPAEAGIYRYVLVEIISKIKKDSFEQLE
jgi:hypothetical protein